MLEQRPLVERCWIYHKKECPDGKIVETKEYQLLMKNGWVKNPNDFKKSGKDKAEEPIVARETLDGSESHLIPEVITEE